MLNFGSGARFRESRDTFPADFRHDILQSTLKIKTFLSIIGVRAGGAGGAAAPPVAKIFGQNACDSGKHLG